MWERKDESTSQTNPPAQPRAATGGNGSLPAGGVDQKGRGVAQIGRSLKLQGEISGKEDLYIDGEVEGDIKLDGNRLTVGPNGNVRAAIQAHSVTILGRAHGNVQAEDCVELRKTASFEGDVVTARIIIEEGAVFRGSIDILKPGQERNDLAAKRKPVKSDAAAAAKKSGAA